MEDVKLLGLLNPIIANLFALTFIVFWLKQKEKFYILAIGLSYAALGTGFLAAHFLFEKLSLTSILFVGILYVLATSSIIGGLYKRAGLKGGVGLLLSVGLFGVALSASVALFSDDLNTRIYLSNATLGLLFGIGAWRLRKTVGESNLEKLIVGVLVSIALQFIVLTAFTVHLSGVLTPENYRSSLHWTVVNFATAITSIILALTMIGMCSSDLLKQITLVANLDGLSGLQTRRAFESQADQMMLKLQRTTLPVSLLIIDIDHFKKVNDQFGHPVGDAVIKQLGSLIEQRMRISDAAGRLGGEEFSIMLWNAEQSGARLLAEEIRSTFSTLPIDGIPDEMDITVSIGVATIVQGETYESLYCRADAALYSAKHRGRNRAVVASGPMTSLDAAVPAMQRNLD